jgi:hypothetical protein
MIVLATGAKGERNPLRGKAATRHKGDLYPALETWSKFCVDELIPPSQPE